MPLMQTEVDGKTVLWTVATKHTRQAVTFYDSTLEGLPEGISGRYLSGMQTLVGGESGLFTFVLDKPGKLTEDSLDSVEASEVITVEGPENLSVVYQDDEENLKTLVSEYTPLVEQQVVANKKK